MLDPVWPEGHTARLSRPCAGRPGGLGPCPPGPGRTAGKNAPHEAAGPLEVAASSCPECVLPSVSRFRPWGWLGGYEDPDPPIWAPGMKPRSGRGQSLREGAGLRQVSTSALSDGQLERLS